MQRVETEPPGSGKALQQADIKVSTGTIYFDLPPRIWMMICVPSIVAQIWMDCGLLPWPLPAFLCSILAMNLF